MSSSEPTPRVTERLAQFLVDSRWQGIPAAARHEAKRTIVNFVGTALGGCRDPAVELAVQSFGPFFGPPQATVIGRSERPDALSAAFLNAISANVLEFDDTHVRTVIHPAAPVAPAVFAFAELRPVSGKELLHALILGIEAECRIGNAVSPAHYRRGWHITSTCGVFGAAAAAGKLLGLDPQGMIRALGNAAAQSAGLIESLGSMAKSISVGNAARNGLAAALLAEQGFTAPEQPIEGTYGFARVMSGEADFGAITDTLGDSWEILANAYKPYPCGVVLFPVIDGCLDLRERHALPADRISVVTVRGHPLLRIRADRPGVTSGREAKVSVQHSVAVAFLYGAAGLAQYSDQCVGAPEVLDFRRKVAVAEDPSIPVETAFIAVDTTDGGRYTAHVTEARGTMARPISDTELETKFAALADYGAPSIDARLLLQALWRLEQEPEIGRIIRSAAPRLG
jgi:2-methylcitrate dehydratase PrpD